MYFCTKIVITQNDEWFESWKHRKPDEHLWHFNRDSLNKFMERMGYVMISSTNIEDTIRKNTGQKKKYFNLYI